MILFTRALHWSLSWAKWIYSILLYSINLRSILILISRLRLGFYSCLFPSDFPTNILHAFFFSSYVLRAPPILSSLTSSFWLYLAKSTRYEAPHYVVFSSLLLFYVLWVQIFSSRTYSRIASVCVPLMSETEFHTHTKLRTKCSF
jgi:hypothetical protein